MQAKYLCELNQFTHIVGIDLATYKTGTCVYDTQNKKFCEGKELVVEKDSSQKNLDLYFLLTDFLKGVTKKYGNKILVTKESCPKQNGPFTTVNTLQSLAGSHAILDVVLGLNTGCMPYDEVGVHSISVKTFFRSEALPKPQKGDIRKELVAMYNLDDTKLTDNITDSMGVVHVLVYRKWNNDIDAQIKELKKEIKKLKTPKAIDLRKEEIEKLTRLKV